MYRKQIIHDRTTRDYAMYLNGELVGFARTYREAQQAIEAEVPGKFDARQRAYLLLKIHGQQLCKRTSPKCPECPVRPHCAYAAGHLRGRAAAARVPGSRR